MAATKHISNTGNMTTDHKQIRKWAEERGAHPACVRGTGGKKDIGMIRLDFPGYTGEDKLEPISWEEFFEKFEEKKLALVFQEETADGKKSNFNKLVSRESDTREGRESESHKGHESQSSHKGHEAESHKGHEPQSLKGHEQSSNKSHESHSHKGHETGTHKR